MQNGACERRLIGKYMADFVMTIGAEKDPQSQTVYPADSTEAQLQSIDDLLAFTHRSLEDLAKPEMVGILLERHRMTLLDLKNARTEIESLKELVEGQRGAKDDLAIQLARSTERNTILWLEIPLSIFSGYAINLLTTPNPPVIAWVILVICLLGLLYIRYPSIIEIAGKASMLNKQTDGKN